MGEGEWTALSWEKGCWEEFLKLPDVKRDREMTRCIAKQSLERYC